MESMGLVQARTPLKVKEAACKVLDGLGLNMSAYINMALKQLVIQGGVPFSVMLSYDKTGEEKIKEVAASLQFEGLPLEDEDILLLKDIRAGRVSVEAARKQIMAEAVNE